MTNHAKYRLLERGIGVHDAKRIAREGITKGRDEHGIVKEGFTDDGRKVVVVLKKNLNKIILITAYYAE